MIQGHFPCFTPRLKSKHDANEVEERFRQRVGDIAFWRSELEARLADLKSRLEEAESQMGRVGQAMEGCAQPLDVAERCLATRQGRRSCFSIRAAVKKCNCRQGSATGC